MNYNISVGDFLSVFIRFSLRSFAKIRLNPIEIPIPGKRLLTKSLPGYHTVPHHKLMDTQDIRRNEFRKLCLYSRLTHELLRDRQRMPAYRYVLVLA